MPKQEISSLEKLKTSRFFEAPGFGIKMKNVSSNDPVKYPNTKSCNFNVHRFGEIDIINSSDFIFDVNFYSPQNTQRQRYMKNITIHKGIDYHKLKGVKCPARKMFKINSKSVGIIKRGCE